MAKKIKRADAVDILLQAAKDAAEWLCEAAKGTDQWERGQDLKKAIKIVEDNA